MNELFSGNQKMDINNLSIIEEKVILIKESFEKIKTERDKLLAEVKIKDDEIKELKDKISTYETDNDFVVKKIDEILNNLDSIQL
jgi:septal ring factor EnvC (AmiA/AmiB activator)